MEISMKKIAKIIILGLANAIKKLPLKASAIYLGNLQLYGKLDYKKNHSF